MQTPRPSPKARTEVTAPPQKVAQAEHVRGSVEGQRSGSGLQPDGLLRRKSPTVLGSNSAPPPQFACL